MATENEWHPKLYIVSRRDLPAGVQACQAIHSVIEFIFMFPEETKNWHDTSNHIVFLEADDDEHLGQLMADAYQLGIYSVGFHEPNLDNDLTSVVFEPTLKSKELLKELPLALKSFK
jgi:hypothetical protein